MEGTQPPGQNQPQIVNPVFPQPEIPLPPSQTSPIPGGQPPIAPVPPKRPPILKMLFIVFFLVVLMSAGYYGFLYYKEVSKPNPTPTTEPTPIATTDPTADWKTYTNEDYAFQFKYPSSLTIDFKNQGFISGSDYYGKRDFNFLIYNPNIEPSVLSATGDVTPESKYAYDGYNFAIFSGESAKNHLKNLEDAINGTHSPAIEKKSVLIAGQEYPLYYIPPSDQPNTDKTSYWFTSFPLKENTMIISGNYDRNVLIQILSTFKFTAEDVDDDLTKWKAWNDPADFTIKYPPTATVTNTNEKTSIKYSPGGENIVIYLSQEEQNPLCENITCVNSKEIEISIASDSAKVAQKWPDSSRNYTFQTTTPYPGKNKKLILTVSAVYPSEENIIEINKILSTLVFTNK